MRPEAPSDIVEHASPRPWSYRNDGGRDWIEDAVGNVVVNNIGRLDGPLIVACVNEANACGTEDEAITEDRTRESSGLNLSARLRAADHP